ncbi:hypothetical protein [Neorhodopirellula lusitana]
MRCTRSGGGQFSQMDTEFPPPGERYRYPVHGSRVLVVSVGRFVI